MKWPKITFVDLQLPSAHKDLSHRIAREPIGLLEMGAFLRQELGIEINYSIIESQEPQLEDILVTNPDIVGFSTYTFNYCSAVKLARKLRTILPKIEIIFGGSHAGMIPELVMNETAGFVDAVISREGENGMLAYLNGQRGIIRSGYIALSKIPRADRIESLFPNCNMSLFNHGYRKLAVVVTSRGCFNTCDFCIDRKSGYRVKPVSKVIEEISYLVNQKGVDTILFEDPLLNGDVGRLEKICDELIKAKKTKEIGDFCALSMIGFNLGDRPALLLEKMAQAGFIQLNWGVEDPRQEYRASLNKSGGAIQSKILAYARSFGIHNRALLMLPANFHCDDPQKDAEEYTRALIDLPLDEIKINITTPYPGTVFYQRLQDENRIRDLNLDNYDTHHLVFEAGRWDQPTIDWARNYITNEFIKSRTQ